MKASVDWSLYLVTDRTLSQGRPLEQVIEQAVRGGVSVVQLREKECSSREFIDLAQRVKEVLEPVNVPLIINDRIDVAIAVGADGLHIGQDDVPYADARQAMGEDAIIGLSIDTPEQAEAAEALDVDYLGIGPIFPTTTKADTSPEWGVEGLRGLRAASRHVLIAIGGVNAGNAAEVLRAGAEGIAVVSAICAAPDVRAAAEELRRVVEENRPPGPQGLDSGRSGP